MGTIREFSTALPRSTFVADSILFDMFTVLKSMFKYCCLLLTIIFFKFLVRKINDLILLSRLESKLKELESMDIFPDNQLDKMSEYRM